MSKLFQPGDRIGDVTIEQFIDEGGFAAVYRVRTSAGERRAIKVAHAPINAMDTAQLSLVQNEIEAIVRLRHPGLLHSDGYGYLPDGRLYIVMELVSGVSLIDLVEQHGGLDPVEALTIIERVAEVMAYCHEWGVIHLDLKPENIVVTDRHRSQIKVVDFGVARLARAGRGHKRVIAGTPAYMAPECFGDSKRHPSMDVYALGVTLHVMITGALAYTDTAGVSALLKEKSQGPPLLDQTGWERAPAGTRELLRAMLAVDPHARPSMVDLRREALRLHFAALAGARDRSDVLPTPSELSISQPIGIVPLVGRRETLGRLGEHWGAAQHSARSAVLVQGAQGMGKSVLIDRFIEEHTDESTLLAYGRCRESGDVVRWGVIREAAGQLGGRLRAMAQWRELGLALREALGPLESVLIGLVPEAQPVDHRPAPTPNSALDPAGVARAISIFLAFVGRLRPVLLVVEDLQWASVEVSAVLQHVSEHPHPGVMLLLSSRTPIQWVRRDRRIELTRLMPTENHALLRSLLVGSDDGLIRHLNRHVPALSMGIPQVTVEIASDLQHQRCLVRRSSGTLEVDEPRLLAYEPPPAVAQPVEQWLERLSPSATDVLAIAALYGPRFGVDDVLELHRPTGLSPDTLAEAIHEAHSLRLLVEEGPGYRWTHDVLATRLASHFDPLDAQAIHTQIADRIIARAGDPQQWAHHLEHADRLTDAARAHLQAARLAEVLRDLPGAAGHYRRVIELADQHSATVCGVKILREALFEYARIAGSLLGTEEAFSVALRGVAALAALGSHDDAVVNSAMARMHYLKGELAVAVTLSQRCLAWAGIGPDTARIRVLPTNIVGRALLVAGRVGEAAVALAQGCQLAAAQAEQVELCHSLGMLGLSLGYTGVLDEARTHLHQAAVLADQLADPGRKLAALCYEAIGAEFEHDWSKGVIQSADALAFAQAHTIVGFYPLIALIYAGRHQFHVGQLQRARFLLEHASEQARRDGVSVGSGWIQAFLGDVYFVQGDYDGAMHCYEQGLCGAGDDCYTRALCWAGRAHVRGVTDGELRLMHEDARAALESLEQSENLAAQAHALLRYADAVQWREGEAAAAPLRTRAERVFQRMQVKPVDWWPIPPHEMGGTGDPGEPTSARAFWQAQAILATTTRRESPLRDIPLRTMTRTLIDHARTLPLGSTD